MLEILDNVRFWDTCPDDYKKDIKVFLDKEVKALCIHDVVGRSEQVFCECEIKGSSFQLNTGEICCCNCEKERAK